MCGILITKEKSKIPLIKHRGIETSIIKDFGYYFAHHRLPIQTVKGDKFEQPLILKDGSMLMYNGEIFNFPRQYDSDVEYLIDLFTGSSLETVLHEANSWDGFWAIVYVDRNGEIYCFTDPLGKKQLYYNTRGEICSEIRPLLSEMMPLSKLFIFDKLYKSSVYKWGYNTDDRTPYENIRRVMPNRFYKFRYGLLQSIGIHPYYKWEGNQPKLDLDEILFKAVQNRLVSKTYNIGCLVSGGLDSSIIAMLLERMKADVSYYTIENNETEYAELLAKYLDFDLNYLKYNVEDDIEEIFEWNETPIDLGSVIPQHKLFEVIPERIVLTGDGADELFGGYRRIQEYDSQYSDVFEELPFYHLPRLDRASMRYTIELRNPFLSHDVVKYALRLPYHERNNKKHLKDIYQDQLPREILDRPKLPLKNSQLVQSPEAYKKKIFNMFYNLKIK